MFYFNSLEVVNGSSKKNGLDEHFDKVFLNKGIISASFWKYYFEIWCRPTFNLKVIKDMVPELEVLK